eukprot:gene31245-39240_t
MRVVLFYCYSELKSPEAERDRQFEFCEARGLYGRVLISVEGINGTLAGSEEDVGAYIEMLCSHPDFFMTPADFKNSSYEEETGPPFPDLQ